MQTSSIQHPIQKYPVPASTMLESKHTSIELQSVVAGHRLVLTYANSFLVATPHSIYSPKQRETSSGMKNTSGINRRINI
jgi:hypothetical protein